MKKLLVSLALLCNFVAGTFLVAGSVRPIYQDVYLQVEQSLTGTEIFRGDRHGEFKGDYVAALSDGSAWKIHPSDREMYERWDVYDIIRVKARTDFYWFTREHKFYLYNQTRDESVKAMLIQHKGYFHQLRIVSTETYAKFIRSVAVETRVLDNLTGKYKTVITYENEPSQLRKIIRLTDDSYWVIKDQDKFDLFTLERPVFIGAQGSSTNFYDFVLIVGDEREADWAFARPQKTNQQ